MRKVIKNRDLIFFIFIVGVLGISRFLNLGYSEYIGDELTALLLPNQVGDDIWNFLLTRRKGPMQFVLSYIPFLFTGDFTNEFSERIPFALMNTLSFGFLFLFVKKITKNVWAGLFAALLVGTNALTTAFGRIVQYQSLNMFFSFLSLYFFADLLEEEKKHCKSSVWGMVFFVLSLLSHWDALFVLPVILAILAKFYLSKSNYKLEVTKGIFLVGMLSMIFFVPFASSFLKRSSDLGYMSTRVGSNDTSNFDTNIKRYRLYNPFYSLEVLLITAGLGIFFDLFFQRKKRNLPVVFTLWFVFCLVIFLFFIRSAGTHIYNVVIPLGVLGGLFLGSLVDFLPKVLKLAITSLLLVGIGFLYYQTYLVVVDHSIEYPWRQEEIFGKKTQSYSHKDSVVQNNLIGFPFKRGWKDVNEFVNEQNKLNEENLSYITNENDEIAKFYMNARYSNKRPFYAIGVKRPMTFVNDYSFPQIKNKHTVKKIEVNGENVMRIYKAE